MESRDFVKTVAEGIEAAKSLAPYVAAWPLSTFAKKILGPACDELAERGRDLVRLYRYGRQLECVKKAERMAEDAGYSPSAVPIKTLFPLLEGASLEEDEDLHTMWAALLANAAHPTHAEFVRPSFVAMLKQMTPSEAMVLRWMYAALDSDEEKYFEGSALYSVYIAVLSTTEGFDATLDSLESMAVIRRHSNVTPVYDESHPRQKWWKEVKTHNTPTQLFVPEYVLDKGRYPIFSITARGKDFVKCCSAPSAPGR